MDTVSIGYGEEKEKEKEEEQEQEQKQKQEVGAEAGSWLEDLPDKIIPQKPDPVTFYTQNITAAIPPIIVQDIDQWIAKGHFDEPEEIIIEALRETILNGTKSWKYTTKILIGWADQGLRTLQQVQAAIAEHARSKTASKGKYSRGQSTEMSEADKAYVDNLRGGQAPQDDPSYDPA